MPLFTPDEKEMADRLAAHTPLVIMGRGHSGTRLLTWACVKLGLNLGTDDDLATADVDPRFSRRIKKIAIRNLGVTDPAEASEKSLRRFRHAVSTYHANLGSPANHWGWKFPETYLIGPYVELTFPQAKYIHMVRDGRDLSYKEHLTDDPTRKLGRKLLQKIGAYDDPHYLQAARSWAWQVEQFEEFRRHVDPARMLELRFEDLCLDPDKTMARVCEFLDMPMTADCQAVLDGINRKKVSEFQRHPAEEIAQIERAAGDVLSRWHYPLVSQVTGKG